MSSVAEILGLPPGVHFRPDDDELVQFYLLPRARGEPTPFPGVTVVDDDAAGCTLPWELLDRHGRGADDEAYFFVRSSSGDGAAARQDRGCVGGGTWKSQKRLSLNEPVHFAGEEVDWSRHNLNLHMGRGEGGGSVGWVMHEYALTDPSCAHLKICHVAFTGHGKNRKRVPGGGADGRKGSEPAATKRARVDTAGGSASSSSASALTTVDKDSGAAHASASADYQEIAQAQGFLAGGHTISELAQQLLSDDYVQGISFAAPTNAELCFPEFVQAAPARATEQQVTEDAMTMMPQPMNLQQTAGMADHHYLCGGDEFQQELLAPIGVTFDEFCDDDVAGISNMMDAGAQPGVVNWEGYQFY